MPENHPRQKEAGQREVAIDTFGIDTFGERLRSLRLAAGFGLQAFCRLTGLEPGNYSRMERGLKRPPRDHAKLEPIRRGLGLEPEDDEWVYLLTLADLAWGLLPRRLLTEEEVQEKMTALLQRLTHGRGG